MLEIEKYGLYGRLVQESDAAFILQLRTDVRLAKFIHPTENNLDKQVEYIRGYKEREARGEDYYFIFYYNNKPVGVARIYHIAKTQFTFGSWLFIPDIPYWVSVAGAIICREVGFEILGKQIEVDVEGTHEDNKGVVSFSKMLGMNYNSYIMDAKGKYLTGVLTKDDFERNKQRFIRIFPNK